MIENTPFYRKVKRLHLGAFVAGVIAFSAPSAQAQDAVLVDPPCETTTCISEEAIIIAKGELVKRDDMLTYAEFFLPEPLYPCGNPVPTGVLVHRQIERELDLYLDGFCANQGCEPTVEDGTACEPNS